MRQIGLMQITPLPQLVPSRACLSCDVCCRFPERDSILRPYFTGEEIGRAIAGGIDPSHFPGPTGCQVSPVPNPAGDGYLCPAFDPTTSCCRIYASRPLDCQIYPLAVMWNAEHSHVVLGLDTKCPFLREQDGCSTFDVRRSISPQYLEPRTSNLQSGIFGVTPEIEAFAEQIAELLELTETLDALARHPRLIGPFQEDVIVLRLLQRVTARITVKAHASGVRGEVPPQAPFRIPHALPLMLHDRPRLERLLSLVQTPLAAYAFAPHFVWRGSFSYWLAEIAGHLCLFAEHEDGVFMPLLPLAPERTVGPDPRVFADAFAVMRARNKGSAVGRVENVAEEWKEVLEGLGYRVRPKDPDYLYHALDLAGLAGDRYKSQRAACNRFLRTHRFRYEPYDEAQRETCLALYRTWAGQQQARGLEAVAVQMLTDSESAHREALTHARALGLAGRTVWVDGTIVAYTFGYERSASVFCVLLEVADRRVAGLAQFLFREFCREASDRGYAFINTMDDSGLLALARSKKSYHPYRMIPNFIVTES